MPPASRNISSSGVGLPLAEIGIPREKAYERAWKYVGYRGYTRFISSHRNFFFVRQYRALNARAILAMQDYILELEEKLNKLDKDMSQVTASDKVHNGSFRQESSRDRLDLIWEIQRRLKDYSTLYLTLSAYRDANFEDDFINSYSQIATRPGVSTRDVESVENWRKSWPNAIKDEEMGYVQQPDDLVYIIPKETGYLNPKFKDFAVTGRPWFRRYPKGDMQASSMVNVLLHDEDRAESYFMRFTLILGLLMLIAPLWILNLCLGHYRGLAL